MDKNVSTWLRAMGVDPTPLPYVHAAKAYCEAKVGSGRRWATLHNMAFILGKHLGARWKLKPIQEITPADCQAWANDLRKEGIQDSTVRLRHQVARAFWRWCVRKRLILFSPMEGIDLPLLTDKPPKCIPPEMYAAIRAELKEEDCRFALDFLLATGVRKGEFKRLNMEDLTEEGLMLTGRKGRDWMCLPISGSLRASLKSIPMAGRTGGPMFTVPLSRLVPDIRTAAEKAAPGMKLKGLHWCRSSCGSYMVSAGTPIYEVKNWLGHKTVNQTEHYCRMIIKDYKSKYRGLPERVRQWNLGFTPR